MQDASSFRSLDILNNINFQENNSYSSFSKPIDYKSANNRNNYFHKQNSLLFCPATQMNYLASKKKNQSKEKDYLQSSHSFFSKNNKDINRSMISLEESNSLRNKYKNLNSYNQSFEISKPPKLIMNEKKFEEFHLRVMTAIGTRYRIKNINPNKYQYIYLSSCQLEFSSISCFQKAIPLKFKCYLHGKGKLNIYFSKSNQFPNKTQFLQQILGIENKRVYNITLGEKFSRIFNFDKIYFSLESNIDIEFHIIFNFGNSGFPRFQNQMLKKNQPDKNSSSNSKLMNINEQINNLMINKKLLSELYEKVAKIKEKRKLLLFKKCQSRDVISLNKSVESNYYFSLRSRTYRHKLNKERNFSAELKRSKNQEFNILMTIVKNNKWILQRLKAKLGNDYLIQSKMIQNYKKTFFLFFITSSIMKTIFYTFKVFE